MARTHSLPTHREPTHPGEILEHEFRIPLNLTQQQLADALRITRPAYVEIAKGRRSVTPTLAIKLERVLGLEANVWLGLQMDVDLYRAIQKMRAIDELVPVNPSGTLSIAPFVLDVAGRERAAEDAAHEPETKANGNGAKSLKTALLKAPRAKKPKM